ncbi:major facilitator superfamily domain-containing protein [Microdochium bolleyi]|uniref:Major facilitator superfamily domain-containing protein n=1 Tax=Microdochium bolleyi TaxID=196109 RepID=A0A136ILU5_9PEZI|nr:major facilitator superfamily domain-containing protein [Microdochium bolleyi]
MENQAPSSAFALNGGVLDDKSTPAAVPPSTASEIVAFTLDDPDDPFNWSARKKLFVVLVGIIAVLNSVFDSSLPSGAIDFITEEFGVTDPVQHALPISIYLVGYILGPLFFSPLSETYGRRIIMVPSFGLFTVFTLGCALAKDWPSFLVFRLICGINASSAIAITSGIYADIYADPVVRGRAIALFISATSFGPQLAPLVSGAVAPVGWRWAFWIGFIILGVSCVPMLFLPETFKPVILRKRAIRLRKENPHRQFYAPIELQQRSTKDIITVTLARPITMLIWEPIVLFSSLYLAFASAIFFLLFEAYPIIFHGTYKMNPVGAGLAFLPIAAGSILAFFISMAWDAYFRRAHHNGRAFASIKEYERMPLACLGSVCYVVAIFWLGWTVSPDIHPAVPMLSGVPFGTGFVLIFIALLNYMTDAYREYAASAAAAASCTRSVFGALLPLAGPAMYGTLGIPWGMSLLGFLSLVLGLVPFAFIRYGERIRLASKLCQQYALEQAAK